MTMGKTFGWLVVFVLLIVGLVWLGSSRRDSKQLARSTKTETAANRSAVSPATITEPKKPVGSVQQQEKASVNPGVAKDGSAVVPTQYRLPGVDRVQTGRSFEDWLSRYPQSMQKQMRAFNKRNHGVYEVSSAKMVAWMAQNGYVMPEDLAAVESMSTGDLRAMTASGNVKAAFLLKDRELGVLKRKFAEYASEGKSKDDVWLDNPQLETDGRMLKHVIEQSNSPYKGFLAARAAGVRGGDQNFADAQVIGALSWAESLGDFRGSTLAREFVHSGPGREEVRRLLYMSSGATAGFYLKNISKMRGEGCPYVGVSSDNPTAWTPDQR